MTAVLRSTNFLTFKIPDNKKAHSYFKNVKARYWQLKHYLGFRLKSDEIILPWNTVYDDWRQTLVYIFKDYYKIVYLLFVKIYIIFVTRLKAPSYGKIVKSSIMNFIFHLTKFNSFNLYLLLIDISPSLGW